MAADGRTHDQLAHGRAYSAEVLSEVAAQTAAESPLREEVLAGHFFTARHQAEAVRLAAFPHGGDTLSLTEWFGPDDAARLATQADGLRLCLDRDIADIDALIGAQLDAILHHPRLQRLEGSWRGLAWLVEGLAPSSRVKVKVLNLSWSELCRDLERAAEFDQSGLFRKVYEEEFGSPGGEPYGLLVIDHELRHRPGPRSTTDDVTALATLAGVAAAAFAPTVIAASPALLGVDTFVDLAGVADLSGPFRGPDYTRWRSIATREDSRFLAVVLPRFLARPPWRDDPGRRDGFRYTEYAPSPADRVWSTAGYGFAACATRAFALHAWPADVRGVDTDRAGGGLVTELPAEPFATYPDESWTRLPLEIALTDGQERSLIDLGLMPLSALAFTADAAFGAVRSLQSPAQYAATAPVSGGAAGAAAAARANARLSTQMNSLLCASRFAHYIKMLGREMIGSFRTAEEIERALQDWLMNYVNSNASAGSDTRARYPLVSGRVTVRELPGRPGVFGCTALLQPHFQLDDVATSFRLVTDLRVPGAR